MKKDLIQHMKKNRILIVASAILIIIFFGMENQLEMATDSYDVLSNNGSWRWMLFENGRLINAIIYYVLEKLRISATMKYNLSYFIALICLMISVYLLAEECEKFVKGSKVKAVVIAFCTIANPFIIEYFLFIEKGLFMLAILLNVMAFKMIIKYMMIPQKKIIMYALFFLICAVFIYQITLGVFVILCLPFIFEKSKEIKSFIKYNVLVLFLYAFSMTINYCFTVVIVNTSRINHNQDMLRSFIQQLPHIFIKWSGVVKHAEVVLGDNTLQVIICAVCSCLIIQILCQKCDIKERIILLLGLIFICMGTMMIGLFPWLTGVAECSSYRTTYPCICITGVLLIFDTMCQSKYESVMIEIKHKKIWLMIKRLILNFTVILLFVSQYRGFCKMFINRYVTNGVDSEYSREIQYEIVKYEQASGNKIKYIAKYSDAAQSGLCMKSDEISGIRAMWVGQGDVNLLNFYLDTNYIKIEQKEFYKEYFEQFDWSIYSPEQLIFDKDTLHLCVY